MKIPQNKTKNTQSNCTPRTNTATAADRQLEVGQTHRWTDGHNRQQHTCKENKQDSRMPLSPPSCYFYAALADLTPWCKILLSEAGMEPTIGKKPRKISTNPFCIENGYFWMRFGPMLKGKLRSAIKLHTSVSWCAFWSARQTNFATEADPPADDAVEEDGMFGAAP